MSNILTIINQDGVVLAYLNNLESASVHKVINGEYVLNFVAIIEELKTEFLYDDSNLIVYDNDYFRIVTLDDEHDSNNMLKVTVSCEHISYDLIVPKKLTFTHENRAAIYVMNDLLTDSGYTFTGTDVTTTASIDIQQETDIKSLLYQVAVIWGGEIEYFRKEIALKQQLGQNRGTDFRFGKNIENIRRHVDKVDGTVSYEVEVVQGSELEELGYYELGDTIRVVDDALNIEIDIRIIDLERDLVTGLNGKVVLGQPIKDLTSSFSNFAEKINSLNLKVDQTAINLNNAIETVAGDVQAVADGQVVTYYQDTEPIGKLGDLWFNTLTKKLYRHNDTAWTLIEDAGITTAIEAAQNAQAAVDGKITSFYQDTIPTVEESNLGDLWIDTNDSNKLYRFNGTDWVSARDGSIAKIDNVIDANGNLIASKLSGTLQTAVQTIEGSKNGGISYVPNVGVMLHNQPTAEASTEAMLLTANGILISNSKNADGSWRWRTAATGQSISADAITTGQLTAITITGVTITGSSITSDDANSEIKLLNGVLSIKKKLTSQQFNMNYRAGLPAGVTQTELEKFDEFKSSNPSKPAENTISLNSVNSHMGLEFGNGAVSLGNNWVKIAMYGGTSDWQILQPAAYQSWLNGTAGYLPPPEDAQGSKMIISMATSYWHAFQNDYYSFTYGNSELVLDVDYVTAEGNMKVYGNFEVSGTKDCTIMTEQFGKLNYSAYETAEIYLGDIGESEVIGGECIVNIDEKLLACVNTELPYQVFLQAYGDGRVYVSQRNATSFIVRGDNIKFAWEVKAKRKNYENVRFGTVRS